MKHFRILFAALFFILTGAFNLEAQSLKGMSLNGSTGLYSIPSGRIAWERSSDFGIDIGYSLIVSDEKAAHIPKMAFSFFKWVELSLAFDIQPDGHYYSDRGADFIGGLKIQFPLAKTALALGGNFQAINTGKNRVNYLAGQVYVAATYAGHFFNMPAETTVVLGKTFIENRTNSNIDYGMGFDMILFPDVFGNYIHWVLDFANFSYSVAPFGADSWGRGVLNTGLRIDLASIPALNKFKFVIDILITDAFDTSRAFSAGLVFGIPIL